MAWRRSGSSDAHVPKRIYATLGVAALAVALLGCGDDEPTADRATTTVAAESSTVAAPDMTSEATGSINEEEPQGQPSASIPPVTFDETADYGNGVTARLSSLESIDATSSLPGEFSGPAVVVTVELTNGSSTPADVGAVTVDLQTAQDVPAYQVTTEPAAPFSGEIQPGESATARYVFTVAPEKRAGARISINYLGDQPTVTFSGDLPNA